VSSNSETSLPGIAYQFSDPRLLKQALTHRSLGSGHYERLEFLGDSLLNLVAAEMLYRRRPRASEGDLSRLRSRLVRGRTLAEIAKNLDLGDRLRLGQGELKSGGFLRESILADVLEALFGAVYLDGGFQAAREVIEALLDPLERELPEAELTKDPKTRLQELLQSHHCPLPEYKVMREYGADHAKRFEVECSVGHLAPAVRAEASSRRKAEQVAARRMREQLLSTDPFAAGNCPAARTV